MESRRSEEENKSDLTNSKEDYIPKYAFEGDPDVIIEPLEQRRVTWDENVVFSKNGLMSYIDEAVKNATEFPKKWKKQLDKPDIKIFSHVEGSSRRKDFVFYKTEATFRKNLKLEHIIKAIYDPKERLIWEKKCLNNLKLRATSQGNSWLIYYYYKRAMATFHEKSFSDKLALFEHAGAIYANQTTNGLAEEDAEEDEKTNSASYTVDKCTTYLSI